MKKYTTENLNTDLEWFSGLGVERKEAESYIKHLLNSEWEG